MDRSLMASSMFVATCLAAGSAWAQTRTGDIDYARAESLRGGQHLAEALAMYAQLHEQTREPRALAQVGVTEAQMGRWVAAEQHLTEALATGDRWVRHHRGDLQRALDQVRGHLDDVTVTSNVPGAELRIDDTSIGRLPRAAVRVARGPVVIDVVAEGYEPHRETVQASGTSTQVTVTLVPRPPAGPSLAPPAPVPPAPAAAPVAAAPVASARLDVVVRTEHPDEAASALRVDVPLTRPSEPGGVTRTFAWVSAGTAVALAVTGVAALVVGSGAASNWNGNACVSVTATREMLCPGELSTAETMATLATVGFVGAGVLAGTSVGLFVASMRSGGERSPVRSALSCGMGPGTVGVSCGGRF